MLDFEIDFKILIVILHECIYMLYNNILIVLPHKMEKNE